MARALWLPSVLRSAGLTVHEQPGWQTRGSDTFEPRGVIIHATAGRLTIEQDIHVLLTGSTTAPPPISQLFLSRGGEWWVIASGRCNHALTGRAGNLYGLGNGNLLGVEAANDNRTEPWPDVQYQSYVRGVRAICDYMRWGVDRISGHKEHQPGDKSDPTFSMDAFRASVANPQEEEMSERLEWFADAFEYGRTVYAGGPIKGREIKFLADFKAVQEAVAELKSRPTAVTQLSTEDRDAIVAQLRAEVGDVVEDALRRVLGGLDGATPGNG